MEIVRKWWLYTPTSYKLTKKTIAVNETQPSWIMKQILIQNKIKVPADTTLD